MSYATPKTFRSARPTQRYNEDEPCLNCGELDGECACTLEIEARDAARHGPSVDVLIQAYEGATERYYRSLYDSAVAERAWREAGYGR
jgi:hypothetical protein